jgi:hypothetical protein
LNNKAIVSNKDMLFKHVYLGIVVTLICILCVLGGFSILIENIMLGLGLIMSGAIILHGEA